MDFGAARRCMVQNQIVTNRITDPLVIAQLSELPRELFLPEPLRGIAYVDEDVPLGQDRYLIEPLIAALLVQAAEIDDDDLVLDVGTGTGYTAALAAGMASAVVALESDPPLAAAARTALAGCGCESVEVVEGPLAAGWPAQAPYDAILFAGGVAEVPRAILDQLAEGGRLVAVVMQDRRFGHGQLFLRHAGVISHRTLFDASLPLLPGFAPEPTFRF